MNQYEQADAFRFELLGLIKRYLLEFDLPIETLIGVMESTKIDVLSDPIEEPSDAPCEWDDDFPDEENPFQNV
tara:strand:+ start:3979 stop:4197 length:219 start_codon:yes stop_codon:yes gene_type:complete